MNLRFLFLCSLLVVLFSGCGGGGGAADNPAATSTTSSSAGGGGGNPVTPASCASSSATGSISVSSKPGGANIFVDGADTGQTTPKPSGSVTLSNITEGAHAVKLSLSPFSDYQMTVCVSASNVQAVSPQLSMSTDLGNSY